MHYSNDLDEAPKEWQVGSESHNWQTECVSQDEQQLTRMMKDD